MDFSMFGLGSATRGMAAAQSAINTIGNNIANANTEGYSREVVQAVAAPSVSVVSFNTPTTLAQMGGGVQIANIVRERDHFLDAKIRTENATLGANDTMRDSVNEIESRFQEPSDFGLSSVMTKFFNSWDQLATNPESTASRSQVRQMGLTLSDTLNSLSRDLTRMRNQADASIQQQVSDINGYTRQIASLNMLISASMGMGSQPNSLMDQRDLAIENLSKMISVQTVAQQDGKVYVYMQGRGLVLANDAEVLAVQPNDEGQFSDVVQRGQIVDPTSMGGSLGALFQVRDEVIGRHHANARPADVILPDTPDGLLYQLDELANEFAAKVNAYHEIGTDLNGDGGNLFFFNNDASAASSTYIGSGGMMVTQAIQSGASGLNLIAAGSPYTPPDSPPGPGDNGTAQAIASIRAEAGFGSSTTTVNDYYRTFLANLGVTGQTAERTAKNQTNLLEQLTMQRESVSGVSLDQEMSDLVRYQHAYNASAKVISIFDQMLDKLINGM